MKTRFDIETVFKSVIPNPNMMTPEVTAYHQMPHPDGRKLIAEFSFGQALGLASRLYGLTVVEIAKDGSGKHRHDLCNCFDDRLDRTERWREIWMEWEASEPQAGDEA